MPAMITVVSQTSLPSSSLRDPCLCSPHTGTEAISSGTRKHLVGAENVERVRAHADVVAVFSDGLGQVLVDGDAGGLKGLGGDLLLLIADHVRDEWEEVNGGLLGADVVDPDLGVCKGVKVQ